MNADNILFEWRLINRNIRLKRMLLPYIFLIPQVYLMCIVSHNSHFFAVQMLFLSLIALPGCTYSSLIFSTEASFMDKLTISPFTIYSMLQAKYRLYCIFAMVMTLICLPTVLLGIKLGEIIASFLFAEGVMFFAYFQCARFNFKRMDIKATQYYNWQGTTFNGQMIGGIIVFLPGVLAFFMDKLCGENITLWIMSIIGLIFILTNKFWLMSIARNFEKTRYRRLECFREK